MENKTITVEFVKEFLQFKFGYLEHELLIKIREIREFMDRSPIMELIQPIKDKSILISIENKLGAKVGAEQLVDEYEDGMKLHKNFWLVAVTAD